MKKKTIVGGVCVGLFLILQLFSPRISNPPHTGELPFPAPVQEILRASCFDCHSNETSYPWYARVAPVSFLVAHDVNEGRGELNFSEWESFAAGRRQHKLQEINEVVLQEGEMPPWFYVMMHGEAKVTDEEKQVLRQWLAESRTDPASHEED